jgi:hypothetical protein
VEVGVGVLVGVGVGVEVETGGEVGEQLVLLHTPQKPGMSIWVQSEAVFD